MNALPPPGPPDAMPSETLWLPPAPAVAVAAPPGVGRRLRGTLQGFLLASAAAAVVTAIGALVSLAAYREMDAAGDRSSAAERRLFERWADVDDMTSAMLGLALISWAVALVLLIVWMHRLHRISAVFWTGHRKWSRGWTVGGWFVPVANLIIPKLVLDEIEQILDCRRTDGSVDPAWSKHQTSSIGWCWWAFYMTALITLVIQPSWPEGGPTIAQVRAYYVVLMLAAACWCCACLLAVSHVRRLSSLGTY